MKQLTKTQFPLHNNEYDEAMEEKYQDELRNVISTITTISEGGTFVFKETVIPSNHVQFGIQEDMLYLDELIEGSDCKNGVEVGISDEGNLTLIAYGQGYTLETENHEINHLVETTYEIVCIEPEFDINDEDERLQEVFEISKENVELQRPFVKLIELNFTTPTLETVQQFSMAVFSADSQLEAWKNEVKRNQVKHNNFLGDVEQLNDYDSKLLTDELKEKFAKNPLYSTEEIPFHEKEVIAHFFNPVGAGDWYIVEGEIQDGDVLMMGYCHIGDDEMAEWGYISLKELESISLPMGLKIERDILFDGDKKITVNDVAKQKGLGLKYEQPSMLQEIQTKGTQSKKSVIDEQRFNKDQER